jgi:hypothetical protein
LAFFSANVYYDFMVQRTDDIIHFELTEQLEFNLDPSADLGGAYETAQSFYEVAHKLGERVSADELDYRPGARDNRNALQFRAGRLRGMSDAILGLMAAEVSDPDSLLRK